MTITSGLVQRWCLGERGRMSVGGCRARI